MFFSNAKNVRIACWKGRGNLHLFGKNSIFCGCALLVFCSIVLYYLFSVCLFFYCVVLCCVVLCSVVQCGAVLCYVVLYCIVLRCIVLCCVVLCLALSTNLLIYLPILCIHRFSYYQSTLLNQTITLFLISNLLLLISHFLFLISTF